MRFVTKCKCQSNYIQETLTVWMYVTGITVDMSAADMWTVIALAMEIYRFGSLKACCSHLAILRDNI